MTHFALSFLLSLFLFLDAAANPAGGVVAAGDATIYHGLTTTVIHQTTNKAIINWQSFNIAAHETTNFRQPSSSAVMLNRINPAQGVSQIYGHLNANGRIILVNQAGIYFGPGSFVNVGGIIASTSNISNENFLAGKYIFDEASPYAGSIINEGSIIAKDNGLVALIGTGVSNSGLIQAKLGNVVLASGNKFTMDFNGDQLINFTVDEATGVAGKDRNGNLLKNGIKNTGKIIANGGTILVTARVAKNVLDNVINMKGIAMARSVGKHNGVIILSAGDGTLKVSGRLDVSSRKDQGGTIKVLGDRVQIESHAVLNASGKTGGGEILIGGNAHGAGPEQNASYTYIGPNVTIFADALDKGNGGKVVVWSDQGTGFYGTIFARGGASGGNGGFVETSGKAYLDAMGMVDASAKAGLPGQWLLDPFNVTITTTTTNGAFDSGNPNTYTPTANNGTANAATINASLNGGTSVTITTGSTGAQAGNITVSSAILKNAGLTTPTLTLNAAGTITINNTLSATSGGLNVTLTGDALTLNSAVTTNGGNFLSTTQNATTLASAISTGAGTVSINVNQDGLGANAFAMNAGSSITTTNASASAVSIAVNTASGGTGTAALRSITTGSGGTISVSTNSANGNDITMPAGLLDVGTGTVTLSTSQLAGRTIGTSALNIQIKAGNFNATTGNSGIFVTNTGTTGLNLGTVNSTAGLTLTSTGSTGITDSGTLTLPGTLTVAAGATQDITLNSATNNFGTAAITSGRNVTLVDTDGIILGASTISGTLNISAGGTVSQSAALTVSGTPTFTVTTPLSDILLSTQANAFSTTPVFTNNGNIRDLGLRNTLASAAVPVIPTGMRNLTLTFDNAGMTLPAMTLTGTLTATANGVIAQSGAENITGVTTLSAGSGNDITLNNAGNNFSTATITSGNNVLLRDLNALILGASTISGTLGVTTNGAITQSGAGGLSVTGATTLDAGSANNITLNTATNNFSSVGITSGNNVSLRDANSLVLNTSTVSGTLGVTTAGLLSQSGALTVTGVTTLAAGATNDITLNNTNNDFSRVNVTTGNNVTLVDTNALILGTSTVSGTYNVTAGGTLSQNGVLTITGTPTFTLTTPLTDILLSTSANVFTTTPVITNNGNVRDLSLRNTAATAAVPTLPSGLRNLTLTFNNNAMTLPAVTLTGAFTGQALGNLAIGGNLTTGANSTVTVTAGSFSVSDGATFNTNNTNLSVTATDLNLNTTGALNVGSGTLNVTQNTASGSIGLGNTAGTMSISGSELQRMIAAIFNLNAPSDGQIIVDGITAANSANIASMRFFGNSGQVSSMIFENNPSSFKSLTASIDDGITIGSGAALTTTAGSMTLNGDSGGIGGVNNAVILFDNVTSAGTLTLTAPTNGVILNAPVTLTANGITINPVVNGAQNLIINAGTGTINFNSAVGATTPLSSLSITTTTNPAINVNVNTTGNISVISAGNLTLAAGGNLTSSAGSIFLMSGSAMTLNSTITANAAGDSIVVVGQTFRNNKGTSVFNPGIGNYLVWSGDPANDNRGGLTYNFKQYNATYGSTPVAGTGNGFLYTTAPVITASLTGSTTKVYDGNTNATLTNSNYIFSGEIDGDTVTLNEPLNGNYSSPNVGTNIPVTVSGITILSATNGSATVYGYQVTPTASGNIGIITPAIIPPVPPVPPVNESSIVNAITPFQNGNQLQKNNTENTNISIVNNSLTGSGIQNIAIAEKTSSVLQHASSDTQSEFMQSLFAGYPNLEVSSNNNLILLLTLLVLSSFLFTQTFRKYRVNFISHFPLNENMSAISFKLRSSLDSINGFAGLLYFNEAGTFSQKQMEFLSDILTESNIILSNLSKMESGSTSIDEALSTFQFNLRTSLNSIIGFANLIDQGTAGEISPLQKEFIQNIISGSNEALKTVQ
ncbi:MAG TPA: filamentous hemagglutinin N-terminal domain-containing protein [Gammaproteobacteria bacterium]|nr:filamentous hemagglutinin N-terminal domain-containing protein [Gammaproteobacteria bacterium]